MKTLVFTTLFPNSLDKNYSVFVKHRIKELSKLTDLRVVAPVPYFPPIKITKKWYRFSQIPREEMVDGIKVYHPRYFVTPKIGRRLYGYFMYLSLIGYMKRFYKEYAFNIIDSHFVYPDGQAAVLFGRLFNVPVTVTARGADIELYPLAPGIRPIVQKTLRLADGITAVSTELKQTMIGLGVPESKIKLIFNGVDTKVFHYAEKGAARNQLQLPLEKKIIVSVGRVLKHKGYKYLMQAIAQMVDPDLYLYIVGKGEDWDYYAQLIEEYQLKDQAFLVGDVPQDELYLWYSAADVFALTSTREGRPNVVMEALASGCPVLSMDRWGLVDIVSEDKGILLKNYDIDPIVENLQGMLGKEWLRKAISESMASYTWQATGQQAHQYLEKIAKRKDILFFSSDDWYSGLKTSKYHLATRLAREHRVFFINSLSLRRPTLSQRDFSKIFKKLASFFKGVKEARPQLFIYTPLILPWQKYAGVRRFNKKFLLWQFRRLLKKFHCQVPEIWTFLPNSLDIVMALPRRKLIYYCVDDMSAFQGVPQAVIKDLDRQLTRQADLVFAVSQELFNMKSELNPQTFYSPHGVDFDLFHQAVELKDIPLPDDMQGIPQPIIGFYGLISNDWVDYTLIKYLSQAKPDWSFVMIGKVDQSLQVPIPTGKNIHYLSVKPYEGLYQYSRYFDVAVLPFNVNDLTTHSHPLKILEYLSAGRPVVSVDIPEVHKYKGLVKIAKDHQDFLKKIEQALKEKGEQYMKGRIAYARENSWDQRFIEIQSHINNHR